MIHGYEHLTSLSTGSLSLRVQEILEFGWSRRDYPAIRLDQDIPWSLLEESHRSWNFYIHCWDMLDVLLASYSEFPCGDLLKICINIASDWCAVYGGGPEDDLDTPFAWYDMAVGLRSYRLAYLLDAARSGSLLSDSEDALLWSSLLKHQEYLADDSNIAFHNNHGYYQVAGQLAMGRRFSAISPVMKQAYFQGKSRFKFMLNQQFTSDGVHREHSPDYHRMVYDTFSGLIKSGLVEDSEVVDFSLLVEKSLAWFVLPNRCLVNFGDSDYRDISRDSVQAQIHWSSPEMHWQASGGELGKPLDGLKRLEEGGYFIYRQPSEFFSEHISYLAQTAAFHSRTHKHADDLSFFWYDRGEPILVDAGRYGYLGKTEKNTELWLDGHWYSDPKRIYCESTRAHNCLEFDGKNYLRKGVKPYGVALGRSLELSSGLVILETECSHFKGNRHARLLLLMPGEWLIVYDWFHDNNGLEHDARQWFHLSENWSLEIDRLGYEAVSKVSGRHLKIANLLSGSAASKVYCGESEDMMQGWWSPAERKLLPNSAFCYEQSERVSGSFATLFTFSNTLNVDVSHSRVNISGRKIKLRWSDDGGAHQVIVNRPALGDLVSEYTLENSADVSSVKREALADSDISTSTAFLESASLSDCKNTGVLNDNTGWQGGSRESCVVWNPTSVSSKDRAKLLEQKPICIWFTGLSGSGKSTLANKLEVKLHGMGLQTMLLDGDNLRHGLCKDLGMSTAQRHENVRRASEVSKLMVEAGLIVIAAFISPFREGREQARMLFDEGQFVEVFVQAPLALCEKRDPKGLYKMARDGLISDFTGVDSPYEEPERPEVILNTAEYSVDQLVLDLINKVF